MRSVARRVELGLAVGVGLTALALRAEAMPTIGTTSPTAGAVVGDSVPVTAQVSSPYVLTAVTATIGGVSEPMAFTSPYFRATLDVSGEPIAPVTMTISATDANGETATKSVSLVHDHAPVLTVLTPSFFVARPSVALSATCADTDGYGCASVKVEVAQTTPGSPKTTVATAAGAALSQTVSLSAWEGQAIDVTFTATDTAGASTSKTVRAYVESDPHLTDVEAIDGNVLDVDATRVLYVNEAGVYVKDRATGVSTKVGDGTPATETAGHLSSSGAIWTNGDWIGGITTARTTPFERARGDWATRHKSDSSPVYRQNLVTGAIELVAQSFTSGSTSYQLYGLADIDVTGTVAYTLFSSMGGFRWEIYTAAVGGSPTLTVSKSTFGVSGPSDPVIDGSRLAFRAHMTGVGRSGFGVQEGAVFEVLDATLKNGGPFYGPFPYRDFVANDGWLAYDKVVAGSLQIWTRSPAGVNALASALTGVTAAVAGVNASGDAVYDVSGARYISAAGVGGPTKALAIGGANGLMTFFGGAWYEMKGRHVFRVDPVPAGGGDAGAPDGGDAGAPDASDAGSSAGSSGSSGSSSGSGVPSGSSSGSPGESSSSGGSSSVGSNGADPVEGGAGCATASGTTAPVATLLATLALGALGVTRRRLRRRSRVGT